MSLTTYLGSRRLVQMLLYQMITQRQKMMMNMTFLHKETHNPMFPRNPVHPERDRRFPIRSKHLVAHYGHNTYGQGVSETINLYMLTMVTFNLKERERCNGQVCIIDSSHFIIHNITLLCHYDVINKCSCDTKWCTV